MLVNWYRRRKAEMRSSVEINGGARRIEKKTFIWKINNFDKIILGTDTNLIEKQKFTFGAGSAEGKLCEWEVSLTGPSGKSQGSKKRWVGINFCLKNNLSNCEEALANLKLTIFASNNEIFWQTETGALNMTRVKYCNFPKVVYLEDDIKIPPCLSKDGSLEIHLKFTLYSSGLPVGTSESDQSQKFSEIKLLQKLSEDYKAILGQENKYWDVSFICRDKKELKAHKFILCARSPVFHAMFHSGMKEDLGVTVKLKGITSGTMELLLHYIYSGSLPSSWTELGVEGKERLSRAADKYGLVELVQFLKNEDENVPSSASSSASEKKK